MPSRAAVALLLTLIRGLPHDTGERAAAQATATRERRSRHRLGEDHLLTLLHRGVEAARPVGVTRGPGLVDDDEQAVAVAVEPQLDQPLGMSRSRALAP